MDTQFLQHIHKDDLIQGVDEDEKTFIVMPYEQIKNQRLYYVMVAGMFIYNTSILINKNELGLWNVTLEKPLLYGFTRTALLETAIAETFGIQGVHCTQRRYSRPTLLQPYFLYIYTMHIPYKTRISINTELTRFIDITLLKQSIALEPRFFTPLLIHNINIV